MPMAPRASKLAAGADNGMPCASITADTPEAVAHFGEIAGETIGYIHRRMRVIANRLCQRVARLRHAIAFHQHCSCRGVIAERGSDGAALENIETKRGVADGAGRHDAVARLRSAAMDHLARRYPPERGDRDHKRARRGNRVAAEQRAAEICCVPAQPAREWLEPRIIGFAQRQGEHKARRRGALGGEIGEINPQRLACDGIGRIAGEEMHALDDGIGRHHDVVARGLKDRRVVAKTERTGIGRERAEVARDQQVFSGLRLRLRLVAVGVTPRTNSSGRNWRAI